MAPDAQARLRRLLQDLLSPSVLPALVLAGCLSVTAVLWQGARADAEQDVQTDFDVRARALVNNLDQRMQTYVQVLYGAQGLFASSAHGDDVVPAARIYDSAPDAGGNPRATR